MPTSSSPTEKYINSVLQSSTRDTRQQPWKEYAALQAKNGAPVEKDGPEVVVTGGSSCVLSNIFT